MKMDHAREQLSEPDLFVGRETELGQLHKILGNVLSTGQCSLVLISGDYGVGKTSLVEKFLKEVFIKNIPIINVSSKCTIDNENNGLIPFNYLILEIFKNKKYKQSIIAGDILDFIKEVAPAWIDIFTAGIASAAAKTYEEGKKILKPPTSFSQENIFVQYTNIILKITEKKPLLIHLEDLHWADASSLQLLFHIFRYANNIPLMIMCTYRPVEALETGKNSTLFKDIRANLLRYGAREIMLKEGIDIEEYIRQRFPLNEFPNNFITQIKQTTEGHALFVSQLLTLLQETSEIYLTGPESNIWTLSKNKNTISVIPQNVGEVLDQRLLLMTDSLRETLTYASIEGDDFSAQSISKLKKIDENTIYEDLGILEHRFYLINEQETKNSNAAIFDFYRFTHRFFREHIYKKLSKGRLRNLHKQMGECLEALYINDTKISGQLVIHFKEAGLFYKSAKYALIAAQLEQELFAWDEAENWCKTGLQCLGELSSNSEEVLSLQLKLLESSGKGLYLQGNYKEAMDRYKKAITLPKSPNEEIEFYVRLAEICDATNMIEEAITYINLGEAFILSNKNLDTNYYSTKLSTLSAVINIRLGENIKAVKILKNNLNLLDASSKTQDILRLKIFSCNWLGVGLSNLGQFEDFSKVMKNALQISREIGDDRAVMTILITIVDDFILWSDNIEEGFSYIEEAISIAKHIGDNKGLAHAQGILGAILLRKGKIENAIIKLREAISLNEKAGIFYIQPYFYTFLALALLKNSENQEAYLIASQAVELSEEKNYFFWGLSLDVKAQIEAEMGDWEAAKLNFEKAIKIHRDSGGNQGVAETQLHYAKLLLNRGEKSIASKLLSEAINTFNSLGVNYSKKEAEESLRLAIK